MNQEPVKKDHKRTFYLVSALVAVLVVYFIVSNTNGLITSIQTDQLDELLALQDEVFNSSAKTLAIIDKGDDDGDGINNLLEAFLMTDPVTSDTDGDGYSDFEEFINGYDPASKEGVLINSLILSQKLEEFSSSYQTEGDNIIQRFYLDRAIARVQNGLVDRGMDDFSVAYAIEPRLSVYEEFLFTLHEEENYDLGLEIAENYIEDYPVIADAYFHRGFVLQQLGDLDLAMQDYLRAKELGSTYPYLYNNLGVLSDREKQYALAISYYRDAIKLAPEEPLFYENIALSFESIGDVDLAKEFQAKAEDLRQ